jgi:nucleoside-diphosphate-sugar epimerase
VSLAGKRCLVIGGTGFVGGRLAERLLLEAGAEVRVTVRDWRKAAWISRTRAELVEADVLELPSIRAAAEGCEVVFHCASGVAASGGYRRTNQEGTANVIQACRDAGVRRLVYVSTVAVHGNRPGMKLSSETAPRLTGRDYSDSKIVAEQLVVAARQHLETVIVRPTYVWGPRSNAFTIRQLREMMAGSFLYVDEGRSVSNAVYIDNLVDALIAAATSASATGNAYLVTDDDGRSWRELFQPYADYLGIQSPPSVDSGSATARLGARGVDGSERALLSLQGPRSLPVRAIRRGVKILRDGLRRRYVDPFELDKFAFDSRADISSTRRDLGYEARHGFPEAMKTTLEWLDDQMGHEVSQWRGEPRT